MYHRIWQCYVYKGIHSFGFQSEQAIPVLLLACASTVTVSAACCFVAFFIFCQVGQYVESKGARSVGSYRAALQAQCKALLDSQHSRSVMQLQQLLEHEQWVVVEVHASFQHIVEKLALRCVIVIGPA